MLSKNKLQYLSSLQNKKFREQYKEFLIEGDKIVREALLQNRFKVLEILALPDWVKQNSALFSANAKFEITIISEKDLERISSFKTPNQVLARLSWVELSFNLTIALNGLTLYLDGVQDPGNVGTMIRTAEWYGVEQVVLSLDSVDKFNAKCLQSCMGSFFRVSVIKLTFHELKAITAGIPWWGATLSGQNINNLTLKPPGILVMGNESAGIRPELEKELDKTIKILRSENSQTESLNVSVATGILLDKITFGQPQT